MNFKEYLNQDPVQKRANVKITPADCLYYREENNGNIYIGLKIKEDFFHYIVHDGSHALRTLDSDGNALSFSCFVIDHKNR
jgi:hypothetical protein